MRRVTMKTGMTVNVIIVVIPGMLLKLRLASVDSGQTKQRI